MLARLARGWWLLTLRGLVALFYALVTLIWFGATPLLVMLLLSMYAFVDGILGVIAAFESHEQHGQRAVLLPMGLAGILVGLLTLFWPEPNPPPFAYLIGGWAVLAGILEAVASIRLHKTVQGYWLLTLKGGLLAIFGIVLLIWSRDGLLNTHYLIALGVAALGALSIIGSWRLGDWRDSPAMNLQ